MFCCCCRHQFGNFAGQLGDGAAIYLGEASALSLISSVHQSRQCPVQSALSHGHAANIEERHALDFPQLRPL
jgi:hypothetical protein